MKQLTFRWMELSASQFVDFCFCIIHTRLFGQTLGLLWLASPCCLSDLVFLTVLSPLHADSSVQWSRIPSLDGSSLNGPTDIPEYVQKLSMRSMGWYGNMDWMLKQHREQLEGQNLSSYPLEWEGSISRLQNHGWRMDIERGSILSTALD